MGVTKNLTKVFLIGTILLSALSIRAEVTYLISLKGQEFEMGNLLEWSTLQEFNSSFFMVEKSIDGIDFNEIGQVAANGLLEGAKEYHFLDIGANDEKAFYRLKEIETDGSYSFSHTILIKKQWKNNFSIVNINTTEIKDQLNITLQSQKEGNMDLVVLDESGNIFASKQIAIQKGVANIPVEMQSYPEGIYRIGLTLETEREMLVLKKVDSFMNDLAKKDE
ncbi:MAG: hypothetical protein R2879_05665 [Saprospiraceae bacterium]